MKKRIISLTTSMAMVSSLFVALPINTYAADSIDGIYAESLTSSAVAIGDTFTIGSLTYEVIADNEVEVSDCDYATSGAIDIPACVSYGENDFNVTSIGDKAFEGCSSLTSVTIPNSVTSIGDDAFEGCFDLTSINVDKDNTVYSSIDGVLYDKAKTQLIRCPGAKTSVTIPNSVTSIGGGAFAFCKSLTSVTIPNGVTSIGDNTFLWCISLTSVTIPDSVTSIGYGAFDSCESLTSVTIPDSVTSIGDEAFAYCSSLTDVYYTGTQEEWNKISFGSYNDVLENSTIHYHTHKFTSWTTTKPATCTSTGTQARKCSACGKTETKVIPKLAHRYTATAVKPTYAAKGYTLHKCSVCGTSYKDNYTAKKTVPTVSVKSSYTYAPDAVRINWNKVSGASGYKIFRYNTATKKCQVV